MALKSFSAATGQWQIIIHFGQRYILVSVRSWGEGTHGLLLAQETKFLISKMYTNASSKLNKDNIPQASYTSNIISLRFLKKSRTSEIVFHLLVRKVNV